MLLSLKVNALWKFTTEHKFNAIAYGKLFQRPKDSIVTIGEDGIVRIYDVPTSDSVNSNTPLKPIRTLETKCGPASHILLKDVTRLSPCDMLVSDTRGTVVLFCDGQILVRRCSLTGKSSRVTALAVQETALGHVSVVVGRGDGEVSCFNTFSELWKLRLQDLSRQGMKKSVSVKCILATSIVTSSCGDSAEDYILVGDSEGFLHVIAQGKVLTSLKLNSSITTMAAGYFLQSEELNKVNKSLTQLALGCSDGSIWICVDFNVDKNAPYADIGHPITHLHGIPTQHNFAQTVAVDGGAVDMLVCGGHFAELKVFQHGKLIFSHQLPSWPTSICSLQDSQNSGNQLVDANDCMLLVGCQNSMLQLVAIT